MIEVLDEYDIPERLVLPAFSLPPSTNSVYFDQILYNSGKPYTRRTLTKEGERYKQTVIAQLSLSGWATRLREFVETHICVDVYFYVYRPNWLKKTGLPHPNKNAGDADNRIKILQDAVFKSIGIDDSVAFFVGARKMHGDTEKVIVVFAKTPDVVDEF